jgi:hypothetical protein
MRQSTLHRGERICAAPDHRQRFLVKAVLRDDLSRRTTLNLREPHLPQ